MNNPRIITALNAVVATTVSSAYYVGGAKRIALLFRRADHGSGSSAFTVKASMDDATTTIPTMTAFNLLIDNVTNANTQMLTRVNGKTLAANGDAFLFVDMNCMINWLEITVTETTDGTHSAFIISEY
jgi:hypothetical protein